MSMPSKVPPNHLRIWPLCLKENIYTKSMKGIKLGDSRDKMAIIVITVLALAMRLIYISFPAEVV